MGSTLTIKLLPEQASSVPPYKRQYDRPGTQRSSWSINNNEMGQREGGFGKDFQASPDGQPVQREMNWVCIE